MTNFKLTTMTVLAAGLIALPIAASHAEGMTGGTQAKTGTSANAHSSTEKPAGAPMPGATADGAVTASTFSKMDTDKSGSLSESEFRASGHTGMFSAYDTNKDGYISLSELNAHSKNLVR